MNILLTLMTENGKQNGKNAFYMQTSYRKMQ